MRDEDLETSLKSEHVRMKENGKTEKIANGISLQKIHNGGTRDQWGDMGRAERSYYGNEDRNCG